MFKFKANILKNKKKMQEKNIVQIPAVGFFWFAVLVVKLSYLNQKNLFSDFLSAFERKKNISENSNF
jgi:hypothetical protein